MFPYISTGVSVDVAVRLDGVELCVCPRCCSAWSPQRCLCPRHCRRPGWCRQCYSSPRGRRRPRLAPGGQRSCRCIDVELVVIEEGEVDSVGRNPVMFSMAWCRCTDRVLVLLPNGIVQEQLVHVAASPGAMSSSVVRSTFRSASSACRFPQPAVVWLPNASLRLLGLPLRAPTCRRRCAPAQAGSCPHRSPAEPPLQPL